jgi:hypothetical protein
LRKVHTSGPNFQIESILNEKDADGKPIDHQSQFLQAVQEQLRLTLVPSQAPIEPPVIDRVSMPSPD